MSNIFMEDGINLLIWSCMKSTAKKIVDVYATLQPFFQAFNFVLSWWEGSWVYISLFFFLNNIRNNIFLCFVCCNLEDMFNAVPCFLICMLACSDGLQHCSSMPHWHQNTPFLYSGTQSLSSFLKCNRTVTDTSMLYIAVYSSRV